MYSVYKLNKQGDSIHLDVLLSNLEPILCSMSSSNYCFLTCIQVSQEIGKVVWYSHLLRNFPQFVMIHTVRCFSVVIEAEVEAEFLEFPWFLYDPVDVGNLISVSSVIFCFLNLIIN